MERLILIFLNVWGEQWRSAMTLATAVKKTLLDTGHMNTKADCASPHTETQFVSNHIWHCHHTVISCLDTASTAIQSWRSNWIFSVRVWRLKGSVTVPSVILICAPSTAWKLNLKSNDICHCLRVFIQLWITMALTNSEVWFIWHKRLQFLGTRICRILG